MRILEIYSKGQKVARFTKHEYHDIIVGGTFFVTDSDGERHWFASGSWDYVYLHGRTDDE